MSGKDLCVSVPYADLDKARAIPQRRWSSKHKAWVGRPSLSNMQYIRDTWPDATWDRDSSLAWTNAQAKATERETVLLHRDGAAEYDFSKLEGPFKKEPFEWQKKCLLLSRDLPAFAVFADQGTGKTKEIIDDAAHNWRKGRIEALVILAPNDVKTNWVAWPGMLEPGEQDAIDAHMAPDVPVIKGLWISNQNAEQRDWWKHFETQINQPGAKDHMIVLAVNYDALNVERLFEFLMEFTKRFKTMIVADESTDIKTPGSGRTKAAKKVRKQCKAARILTGTPIIKRPLDAYAQFDFLDEDILGYGSFYAFKNDFAIMGGFKNKQVMKYRNLDKLEELIASCSFRVTKDECFDLPPKQHQKIRVEMTKEQAKAYNAMREDMIVEAKGKSVTATIAITQVMRLAQITGGYITDKTRDIEIELVKPEHNPKMQAVMRLVEEAGDQQGIVWAHFRSEIEGLAKLFKKAGVRFAEFHGGVSQHDRLRIRKDFQAKKYDWLIANQACGGRGIDEFKGASLVAYLSNSHDTEDRIQSEDRTHRNGMQMERPCNYYDILVPNTVDVKLIQTLRANKQLSDEIMRDGVRAWI